MERDGWLLGLAGFSILVGAALAVRVGATHATTGPDFIAPDAIVEAAQASPAEEGESLSLSPGLAIDHSEEGSAKPPPAPRSPSVTITTLEPINPWTGEDLTPQLELAAAARKRLEFDRTDPWDPSKLYPGNVREEPVLDPEPWARGPAKAKARDERVASARIRPHIDTVDPWN
jgi:hypothetical protein